MPKIVNHEEKREQIIDFAWRSIVKNGAKGSSVREIAKYSMLTPGQIRYYFPNQLDLLDAVAQKVHKKVRGRIEMIFSDKTLAKTDKAIQMLLAAMPIDEERFADMEVWMFFAYEHHEYRKDTMDLDIYLLCKKVIEYLDHNNLLKPSIDIEKLILKTHALLDGLSLHKLLTPNRIDNEEIVRIVEEEVYAWIK